VRENARPDRPALRFLSQKTLFVDLQKAFVVDDPFPGAYSVY
jgi:hypothetical protein